MNLKNEESSTEEITLELEEENEIMDYEFKYSNTKKEKSRIVKSVGYIFESEIFGNIEELELKVESMITKVKRGHYSCSHCGRDFGNKKSHIKEHIETHINGLVFKCKLCQHKTKNRATFRGHNKYHHK